MRSRVAVRGAVVISTVLALFAGSPPGSAAAQSSEPEAARSAGAPAAPTEASIEKAKEVLAAVNEAVGGGAAADVRSLAFEAGTRRVFGDREMSSTFTMRFLFPDKFQRVEEIERPDGTPGGTVTLTVNGEESWMEREGGQPGGFLRRGHGDGGPEARYGGPDGPPAGGRGDARRAMHGEFYRALVALLPGAAPLAGLTVAHVGEAQAPNGQTADVLDVARDGFNARLFVDRQTHLPLMMTYQARSLRGLRRKRGPERGASDAERRRASEEIRRERQAQGQPSSPPPVVENKLFFSDYGDEGGVRVPHKIIRQVGDQVQEEWTITKVELNPDLDAERFEDKRKG